MATSPQDVAALALKAYQFANRKLAGDIAQAANDDQADSLRANVNKLHLAYLKAQNASFQAGNADVETAYLAAETATTKVTQAYKQGKALADRIVAVSGAVTALTNLAAKASALAILAGCAQGSTERQESDRRSLAEARPIGEPVDCVDLARIDHTRVRDNRTIDFHMRGGEVYRNRLRHECSGLGFEDSFAYRTSTGRLCSVDLITVSRSGGGPAGPTCALGSFQRIETGSR